MHEELRSCLRTYLCVVCVSLAVGHARTLCVFEIIYIICIYILGGRRFAGLAVQSVRR